MRPHHAGSKRPTARPTSRGSAGLIGFISAFVPRHSGITEGDIASWASDLAGLGPGYFFSPNRYLFLAVRN